MVVTIPRVAETFMCVIDVMTYGTDFDTVNLLAAENANLICEDLNTSIDEPENWRHIHLVSYDTLTSRVNPLSNGQLLHCVWRFGIFDESYQYKTKNTVWWKITMNAKIILKLQVIVTPGYHSLHDWCYQMMWLFSGATEDPQDDTVAEKHGTEAFDSTVNCSMHAMCNKDNGVEQEAAQWIIQLAKLWRITSRWSESELVDRRTLVPIQMENAHHVDFEWTEEEQAELQILVERYTLQGLSGAWRVHRSCLACFSLVFRDTKDHNDISGQWYDKWPLDTLVHFPIIRWLTDRSLPMLVNAPAEYPEPEEDDASNEALLHAPESNECSLPGARSSQTAVLFCPLCALLRHLMWWLTKCLADRWDICYMSAEMGNDERTELQLKFEN